ncbi:uncharacterized protein LOC131252927 isoform X2 [Magnolia sinica]|uniref:uncharacterized protein LOC131252927 isoform X2 n=1 Tax=Magnolia sinica TaxID=86752 RepID=UPI00265A9435|nr:uncharacterized protein LOC131252927 isoform X2 [Magnolia sinica]
MLRVLGFERQWVKSHFYPSLFSLFFVCVSQFALAMVPRLYPTFSLFSILSISALVLVASALFGRCCRRILQVSASAPALVIFNILFLWGVYIALIREGFPSLKDVAVNAEFTVLLIGLHSILSGDPGFISYDDSCLDRLNQSAVSNVSSRSEDEELSSSGMEFEQLAVNMGAPSLKRVRYCNSCKAHVKGFDHHCPAFGNCQKNHHLFMVLLIGFVIAEVSYIGCSTQFIAKSRNMHKTGSESSLSGNLAIGTMLFCLLQVLWQVVFLAWHIYCICFNIKTDEWINWRKYPEFQLVVPGQPFAELRFKNPYDKGILGNLKDFLELKE